MVNGIDLFFALFNNLAIFVALIVLYSYLFVKFRQTTISGIRRQVILGLSFGIFTIGCMYAQIPVYEGVIVDQRNAIIALSGAFGGPLSAVLSAALAGAFRLYLGGNGALAGVIGVGLAATAGIGINLLSDRFGSIRQGALSAFLATVVILPGFLFVGDLQTGWALLKMVALPYGLAIFLGIFLGGLMLRREEGRIQVERLFKESEEKYRELVERTGDLITYTDSQGNFTFVNHVAEQVLGVPASDCVGLSAFDFIHPDDRAETHEWFIQCVSQKKEQSTIENRQVNQKTGETRNVLWTSAFRFAKSGELMGVGSIARDMTERILVEQSLRDSENRYRTLFEYVPDGILMVDMDGRCLDANPTMCQMLGYTYQELTTMLATDIVPPEDRQFIGPGIVKAVNEPDFFRVWRFQRKDESQFPVEVRVTVMPNRTLLVMVRDITERELLEAQLRQAQKMEAIGQLAGGIAHDFNNILVPILGYVDLALLQLPPGEKLHSNLKRVREAAERAANLTRQILAFGRKQMLEMQVLDLNLVVADFEKMVQSLLGETVDLRLFLDSDLYNVKADKGQIDQVLMNLVINARDAMPQGGKLTIETANAYLDDEYVKKYADALTPGYYAMLAVSDTGNGMSAETRQSVFEPFFTTKEKGKGTGLGLATVYGIIQQHGGTIWVYSEPGKGSTFKIYLPQAEGDLTLQGVPGQEDESVSGVGTILVAEDEEMVRQLVCETLAAYGFEVIEAQDPVSGIRQAAAYRNKLDLLLTDVVMHEMNGKELYTKVAEYHPDIRVLYMSGYTDNVIIHHGMLDEGVNFLQKPFTVQSLVQKVRQVLR